jgi:hypothetical protein
MSRDERSAKYLWIFDAQQLFDLFDSYAVGYGNASVYGKSRAWDSFFLLDSIVMDAMVAWPTVRLGEKLEAFRLNRGNNPPKKSCIAIECPEIYRMLEYHKCGKKS